MSHDVFISHSTKDHEIADKVCSYLDREGITYWIATRDASPGRDWAESIVNALLESKLLLLIFSSNSNESLQVHREINIAADEGIFILPFRIENIRPSAKLRYYLSTPHWLDALPSPNDNHFKSLVNSVKSFLPENLASDPTRASEQPSKIKEAEPEKPETLSTIVPKKEASNIQDSRLRKQVYGKPKINEEIRGFLSFLYTRGDIGLALMRQRLSFLFSVHRLALPNGTDENTFSSKKKAFRYTGIAAVVWLFFVLFVIQLNVRSSITLDARVGLLSFQLALSLIFMIPAWVLAYIAKTHMICGFISGVLAYSSLLTFMLFTDAVKPEFNNYVEIVSVMALFTITVSAIGIVKNWPALWISCGLLYIVYLYIGIYQGEIFRFMVFFGVAGIYLTVLTTIMTRSGIFDRSL
jgi:hypothetical protein